MPRVRALSTILRYLGPWSQATPPNISRRAVVLRPGAPSGRRADRLGREAGPRELATYLYEPNGVPLGAYLVVPGLHFEGPDDPRLDRVCRVLAAAGFVVVAPRLPAFLDLRVAPSVVDDLLQVGQAIARWLPHAERFTVLSISFGSWPALSFAARLPQSVDAVICFGGYADLTSAMRYSLTGRLRLDGRELSGSRDPLNVAALFLNLLPFVDHPQAADPRLERALRELCYQTWGHAELKQPGRLLPFANRVAEELPAELRELFLVCAGVQGGTDALAAAALEHALHGLSFAEPGPAIEAASRPVVLCHGRDDDVIPFTEAIELERRLSPHVPTRLLLTGLYGHTGTSNIAPGQLLREGRTLLTIARTLAAGGRVSRLLDS